jgi:hypothetical protein
LFCRVDSWFYYTLSTGVLKERIVKILGTFSPDAAQSISGMARFVRRGPFQAKLIHESGILPCMTLAILSAQDKMPYETNLAEAQRRNGRW